MVRRSIDKRTRIHNPVNRFNDHRSIWQMCSLDDTATVMAFKHLLSGNILLLFKLPLLYRKQYEIGRM